MNIEGDNIGIRLFRDEDTIPFYDAITESITHLQEFMPWCHAEFSLADSKAWVESRDKSWADGEEYSFIIYALKTKAILGSVAINQINTSHQFGNIGYWVRKGALKRNVATEAVLLLINFGFNELNLRRLEIVMLENNQASRRVAEKVGAKYEGIMQGRLLVRDKALDACMYSVIKK